MDPARAPPPPGHHAQSTPMCPGVGAACIQEPKGEIQDMNLRMEERFRGLWGMQTAEMRMGHSNEMGPGCGDVKAAGMTGVRGGIGGVEERIGKVEERIGKVEERIGKVEERIGKVEERIGKVEQKLANIEGEYPSEHENTVF